MTQLQQSKNKRTPLAQLKQFVNNPQTQQRLSEMLGDEAGTFANSIINLFNASFALQKCEPASVMSQAMIAASLRLPIDPALGYAAIVPYGKKAQFQLMYRGVIQLCLRSGQYESIYDTEVYRDELESYNPITGEVRFKPLTEYKMRPQHNFEDVVGFYCRFRLLNGFNASLYMTKEEVLAHAERYSQSYQRDLRQNKKTSAWSTHPIAMGRKTVILALLTRYGIMSVAMGRKTVILALLTRYGIMSVEMREAFRKDLDTQEYRKSVESRELKPTNGRREKFGFDEDDDTDDPYSSDQDEDDADFFAPDDERPEQADSSTDACAGKPGRTCKTRRRQRGQGGPAACRG